MHIDTTSLSSLLAARDLPPLLLVSCNMPNLFNRKTDSAPSHPTLATTTTPNAKRISLRSPVGLPPSLQVPPSPLSIHKALLVRATARGLRVRPKAGSNQLGSSKKGGVVLGWGVKGKLSAYEQDEGEEDEGEEVEVKGLVGIVRLWNSVLFARCFYLIRMS